MAQRALTCPQCAANIDVPEDYFSDSIQCPSCGLNVSRRTNAGPAPQQFQAQQPQAPRPMPRRAPRPMQPRQPQDNAPAQFAPQPQHQAPVQYAASPQYGAPPQYAQPQYGAPPAGPYPAQYAPGYAYAPPRRKSGLWWLLLIPPVIVGILAVALMPIISGGSRNVDEWPMHRSINGRYEVRMPRAPEESQESMWTALGMRQVHTATVISGLRNYEVSWFDLGPGSEDQYYYDYQVAAEGIAGALKGRVSSLETVTVSGHDARLLRISAMANGSNGMYYMLRVGNRVYLVGAANIDLDDATMIHTYMNTFRVTG